MNIFKYRYFYLGIFIVTMILSILFIFANPHNGWGTKPGSPLNLGIDFTGGTKIYFPTPRAVSSDEVMAVLQKVDLPNFKVNAPQPSKYIDSTGVTRHQVLVYTRFLNDTEQETVISALEAKFGHVDKGQGLDISRVDPVIGKELLENAMKAVTIALILMLIYIWFRFELISGIAAIVALFHDCLLVLGVFGIFAVEVNSTIIAALLTILGYSINDTIVVFDRIRENVKYKSKDTPFVEVANDSILQTFRRSLNTSFTTVIAILAFYLFVPNIKELCFALIVGITSGTYSSIFVASPIWAIYKDRQEKKAALRKVASAR